AKVLGIAHRPGFPLYILVGHLFGLVPFGEFFYRVNFLSALSASGTLALLAGFWSSTLRNAAPSVTTSNRILSVAMAVLAVGGTYTFWMQAVRAEVYAPTVLFVVLLSVCAWRCDREIGTKREAAPRWLILAALLGGVGMGLHNATLASTFPAFAILFFVLSRRARFGWRVWFVAAAAFVIGLSVYLYMPIRAAQNPPLNWGWLPIDRAPGWNGVVGADAWSAIAATDWGAFFGRAGRSLDLLFHQWEWGLVLLTAVGLVFWWRHARRWALLAIGAAAGNLAVTALLVSEFSETNADIHGYLLPALVAFGFLLSGGIAQLSSGLRVLLQRMPTSRLRPILTGVVVVLVAFLALAPLLIYAPFCNLVHHQLAYDFGTESTAWLRPNAVVFLNGTNWDFVLRGLQYCEDWRPDVRVLNRDLLPAAWYRHWVFTRLPDLAGFTIPTNERGLDLRQWAREIAATDIPVYWEFTEIDMQLVPHLIPAGHLFEVSAEPVRVLKHDLIQAQEDFERRSRFFAASDRLLVDYDAQMVYVSNLYRAGLYYESRGLYDRARELFRRALSLGQDTEQAHSAPDRLPPGRWLGLIDHMSPQKGSTRDLDLPGDSR
ncbi:MAG TPA: DUF2723 domain-containing protein, partial [Acidobacteriota bacterium]|nr:DUF2723 domain-containing protein [Acidobacteriota bacterium]